ncbi:insulinase family protein, partial [Candidatus Woesearchaeota archaeon]|nr:insulinase family protein [Candidatus Woesearchaeota archaeon]
SRYETKVNNGISHFLEHLMFKGTTRRPTTLDISKALDSVGAEYNAYTAKDHTLYYIKLANQHTELALDLLSDMLFHSVFDPKEIERERGVIVEEINMYQDNPLMHLDTVLEMGVFGEHHPLGYDIAGPKPNITHLPRQAFFRFMQQHYRPSTMQLVIAGNVPHNTLALARRYFGNYTQPHRRLRPKPFSQSQRQSTIVYRHKDTQQTQLGLGLVAYPYHHPWLPAAQVLAIILGGNMSSRLFIRVRERQGLCYSIHAEASSYTDTGIFSIQAGVDNQRINVQLRDLRILLCNLRCFDQDIFELFKCNWLISSYTIKNLRQFQLINHLLCIMIFDWADSERNIFHHFN